MNWNFKVILWKQVDVWSCIFEVSFHVFCQCHWLLIGQNNCTHVCTGNFQESWRIFWRTLIGKIDDLGILIFQKCCFHVFCQSHWFVIWQNNTHVCTGNYQESSRIFWRTLIGKIDDLGILIFHKCKIPTQHILNIFNNFCIVLILMWLTQHYL